MKKSFRNFVGAVWLLLLLLGSSALFAQAPRTMSYQGVLTDQSGKMFGDGTYRISVRLYDDITSTAPIFAEEHNVVVSNGVFNITIGSVTVIPATVLFDKTYYLGVSVNDGQELAPRTALTSVPYAMRSQVADVAASVAPNAKGVVSSVNGTQGDLIIKGDGATTVTQKGNVITIGTPLGIIQKGGNTSQVVPNNVTFSGDLANTVNTNNSTWMVNIGNGKVTTDRIGSNAVTTAKISSSGSTAGQVLTSQGSSGVAWADPSISGAAGGDLSGSYPDPSVVALRGIAISNTSPSTGNALLYNGSAWAPGNTVTNVSVNNANGVSGTVSNSSSTPAITLSLGNITPSTVAATGTVTGSNLSGTNTGDVTIGTANGLSLSGQVLSLGTASASQVGALTSSDWSSFNAKESAISSGTTAQYWRGDKTWQTLSTSAVPEGTNLYYTDARARGALSNTATGLSYNSSTGATSLTSGYVIPTTTQESNWNDANSKKVSTWTSPLQYSAGTASIVQSSAVTSGFLSSSDWNTFNNKQSTSLANGTVWVGNASGVATSVTPSGDVSMSNLGVVTIGTGAVTSAKILDGTVANADLASGIDAAKIGAGAVSSTEFGYVDGVTSAIQSQLDDKVAKNSSITGATKTKITYDSKGLVTSGADATTSDIAEGTNLYYTNERARGALSNTATGLSYNSSTGATSLTSGYVIPQTNDVLPSQTGKSGKFLTTNGTSPSWVTIDISANPVGGDLSGTIGSATVSKINGATLGTTTATDKNILVANGTSWNSVAVSGDVTISNTGATTIGTGAVTSAKILDGTIVNADIDASAAIADTKLATISTSGKVANSATTATSANTANAIVARDGNGAFSAGAITSTNVTVSSLNSAGVVHTDASGVLSTSAVVSSDIQDGTIAAADIAVDAVTTAKILNSNVTTDKIADDAVTTVKLLNSNVTTAKIADANVTTAKIADANVTTAKIADANVTTAKIADANVTTAKILDGTIVNADIDASAAIADTKLATISTSGKVLNSATTATSANTANAIVARDASGDFTAGTITANLTGTASNAGALANKTWEAPGTIGLTTPNTGSFTSLSASGAVTFSTLPSSSTAVNLVTSHAGALETREASGLTVAGDVTGTLGTASVDKIKGAALGTTTATDKNILVANGTSWNSVAVSGDVTISNTGATTIGTGAVTSAKILDGTVTNADLASGIDAAKIGAGAVSSTEFGYVDGVTSAIQTQLDNKVAKNSSITGDTKTKITYDSKGLVTGGADATTSDIAEGTNLYYTDARARGALSNTATGLSYNSSTGATSLASGYVIPTTTQESNWNDANSKKVNTWTAPLHYASGVASINAGANGQVFVSAGAPAVAEWSDDLSLAGDLSVSGVTNLGSDQSNPVSSAVVVSGQLKIYSDFEDAALIINNANASGVALVANNNIVLSNSNGNASELRFSEPDKGDGFFTAFRARAQMKNNHYVWPASMGSVRQGLRIAAVSNDTADLEWGSAMPDGNADGDMVVWDHTTSTWNSVALSGDVTISNTGATSIGTDAVTSAKILDGTVANADLASGIDAAKIGAGAVSTTEFGYIGGVTSAIQTQIDDKVAKNSSITGATKTKITYDSKGLVTSGADATTSDIAEGSNLYYTDVRSRSAVSNTATGLSYDNSSGVTSLASGYVIPTTTQESNWNDANSKKVSTWTSPLQYSAGTASIVQSSALTSGFLSSSDWNTFNNKQSTSLANGTVWVGNASGVATSVTPSGDVSMSNLGVVTIGTGAVTSGKILDGTIVNADIDALAAIADSKLATISSSGKVSNSATTATDLNTASAIVARDASGNFSAGTITATSLVVPALDSVGSGVNMVVWNSSNSKFQRRLVGYINLVGDVSGTVNASTVSKINGASLGTTTATDKNILVANGTSWNSVAVSGDVTISNTGATTIGTGAVTSAKILDGTVANADLASGIDAAKIGAGGVSSTEFGYVDGVTSAIQTQLDNKVSKNSSITGATKTKITYDSKGLVTSGADATTSDIAEGSNLYYTDARSRSALSNTATGLSYDNTSGVTSLASGYEIPTTAQRDVWNDTWSKSGNSLSGLGSNSDTTIFIGTTTDDDVIIKRNGATKISILDGSVSIQQGLDVDGNITVTDLNVGGSMTLGNDMQSYATNATVFGQLNVLAEHDTSAFFVSNSGTGAAIDAFGDVNIEGNALVTQGLTVGQNITVGSYALVGNDISNPSENKMQVNGQVEVLADHDQGSIVLTNSGTGPKVHIQDAGGAGNAIQIENGAGGVKYSYVEVTVVNNTASINDVYSVAHILSDDDGSDDTVTLPVNALPGQILYITYSTSSTDNLVVPDVKPDGSDYATSSSANLTLVYSGGSWKLTGVVE